MNIVAHYILKAYEKYEKYEEDAVDWEQMTQQERSEWLKEHPNSKYSSKGNDEKRRRYQRLMKEAQDNAKNEKEIAKWYKGLIDNLVHK